MFYKGRTAVCAAARDLVEIKLHCPESHYRHSLRVQSQRAIRGDLSGIWPPRSIRDLKETQFQRVLERANEAGQAEVARLGLRDSELLQEMAACTHCGSAWTCLSCGSTTHKILGDPPACLHCSFDVPTPVFMERDLSGGYRCPQCELTEKVEPSALGGIWELAIVLCPTRGLTNAIRPRGIWFHISHSSLAADQNSALDSISLESRAPQAESDLDENALPLELEDSLRSLGISPRDFLLEMQDCQECGLGKCPICGGSDHQDWSHPGPCPACNSPLPHPFESRFVD